MIGVAEGLLDLAALDPLRGLEEPHRVGADQVVALEADPADR